MTAEGSTGAPLRQQIAEAIHAEEICGCDLMGGDDCWHTARAFLTAADAVVALLNLTEEHGVQIVGEPAWLDDGYMRGPNGEPINDYRMDFWTKQGVPIRKVQRERIDYLGPWLATPEVSS